VQEEAMTSSELIPAFDPALQPIGYALATEILSGRPDRPRPDELGVPPLTPRPAPRALFGWELDSPAA
jgi:hypothetical protein